MTAPLRIFIDKHALKASCGCWIWLNALNRQGYGALGQKARAKVGNNLAHRVAYTAYKGEIPDGLHVLHTCDNPCCVNPEHLFLGTNADNIQDSMGKGRRKGVTRRRPSGLKYNWTKKPGPKPKECLA